MRMRKPWAEEQAELAKLKPTHELVEVSSFTSSDTSSKTYYAKPIEKTKVKKGKKHGK